MESIEECLHSILGERKILLAYVVRKSEDIPTGDDPSTNYTTKRDEMIARARHYTLAAYGTRIPDPVYIVNREKVWGVIASIMRDKDAWTYVRPAQKTRERWWSCCPQQLLFSLPRTEQCRQHGDCS